MKAYKTQILHFNFVNKNSFENSLVIYLKAQNNHVFMGLHVKIKILNNNLFLFKIDDKIDEQLINVIIKRLS